MGLPRIGRVHPGVKYLAHMIISGFLIFLALMPYGIFIPEFWAGRSNEFPNCILNPGETYLHTMKHRFS